jgi:hypothetical protein
MKSNFELELMQQQEIRGWRISCYVLLKPIDRQAGYVSPLNAKADSGK